MISGKRERKAKMPSQKLNLDYSTPKTLVLKLSGDWQITSGIPSADEIFSGIEAHPDLSEISFDLAKIGKWDSALISFLLLLAGECERKKIRLNSSTLPEGVQKLLSLPVKVGQKGLPDKVKKESFLYQVGDKALGIDKAASSLLNFLGQVALSFGRLFQGKAYFRSDDFFFILQRCGADALGLVSLISLLVGMILAFVGAIQLKMFGAQVFIADIVAIAMVRVMGAVMTGVLMAGRTGASFAAELGIMQTNEEIDALKTLGIEPVDFLVIPRILALVIMMPLLTLYADLMGILGGFIISAGMLGLNPVEYWQHSQQAVKLNNLWVGLIHGLVFGIIIAIAGCFRGIRCERSAAGVGEATTSAVVSAITSIVIATAIITYVCQVIGV